MQRQVRQVALSALLVGSCAHAPARPSNEARSEAYVARLKAHVEPNRLGKYEVEVIAQGKFHLNAQYPLRYLPAASSFINYFEERLERGGGLAFEPCTKEPREACRAYGQGTFRAAREGEVGGVLYFSVCDQDRCLIEKCTLTVVVLLSK